MGISITVDVKELREMLMRAYVEGWYDKKEKTDDGKRKCAMKIIEDWLII